MPSNTWALIGLDEHGNWQIDAVVEKEDEWWPETPIAGPLGDGGRRLLPPDRRKIWVVVTGQAVEKGWYYDRATETVSSDPFHFVLTNYQFWDRFTMSEQEDLIDHSNKQIKWAVNWLQFNPAVDLKKTKVINAINALEAAGVIGAGRAAEILATT